MANKPLRPCKAAGCNVLTAECYCKSHKPKYKRVESSTWHGWYNLPVWKRLRQNQLMYNPWCVECEKNGVSTRATVVDHIVSHQGNKALFFDENNLQSLCKTCHDSKTMRDRHERKGKRRMELTR